MSEHMFGLTRGKLSQRECARRDRICRKEGGHGFTQYDQSHGTACRGDWIGWFSGPNLGDPFNGNLARRVNAAIRGE